jgi:hypothetical protein
MNNTGKCHLVSKQVIAIVKMLMMVYKTISSKWLGANNNADVVYVDKFNEDEEDVRVVADDGVVIL